jgi:outer membrane protein TolC
MFMLCSPRPGGLGGLAAVALLASAAWAQPQPASAPADPACFDGWVPDVPNWSLALVLRWTLYDGVIDALRTASERREGVPRAELTLAQAELVGRLQRAAVDVEVTRATLQGLDEAAAAARANYRQADARFRAGLGTSVAGAEALRTEAAI